MTRSFHIVSFLLACTSVLTISARADDYDLDVDAEIRHSGNPVKQPLGRGTYDVTPVAAGFVAWYPWSMASFPVTCGDPNGCVPGAYGWTHRYTFDIGQGATQIWDGKVYPTAGDALAAAAPTSFYLAQATEVSFYVTDSVYDDNTGGVSLKISPQLEIVPPPAENRELVNYCIRTEEGLVVTFRNNSTIRPTGATTVTVKFDGHGIQQQPLLAMPAGATSSLVFPIPSGCFNPDCSFSIKWLDEGVGGYCVG